MFDVEAVQSATGWTVHHVPVAGSTNDEVARLRQRGAGPRTLVVADAQRAGRGREGRAFASPPGGLYVSMLIPAAPRDVPGPLVAASAVAVAEALEGYGVKVQLKWPNDLWIGRRKVGGILLEGPSGSPPLAILGVGVNVERVPADLGPEVRAGLTALEPEVGVVVAREGLLVRLLQALDRRLADLPSEAPRAALSQAWRRRLALKGERVSWIHAGLARTGTLVDASLEEGLKVLDDRSGPATLRGEHVQELRPYPPAPPRADPGA